MTLLSSRQTERGFTLVELAIVLMIIGLLIGGILRGQELMENARVTSTIQQSKAYDGAVTTFRDAYSSLPGDIVAPGTRLANCTVTACTTAGNGDSIIGAALGSKTGTYSSIDASENRRFWLHLAVARLISGVDASGTATAAWGVMYPAARIGGGFHVVYTNITGTPGVSGHFLVLRNGASGTATTAVNEGNGTSAISPLRAAQIDRKLDDGLPDTGDVVGIGTTGCEGTSYTESSEQRNCNLLIRIQS
jgi:prepilin-type N-terminal cleavage/methylation domain-containing protein